MVLALCMIPSALAEPKLSWQEFVKQFITPHGRVIDYHLGLTHSEGQGYAMLLATQHNDLDSFHNLWRWTKANLQKSNKLFAWSWRCEQQVCAVTDSNNATDGDVLIAYALILAAEKWQTPQYHKQAISILDAVQTHLCVKLAEHLFLLPGEYGFVEERRIKLNPSYQILSAYQKFSQVHQPEFWQKISSSAQWLIQQSLHPTYQLPADWLWLDKKSAKLDERSNQYGYEAVRVYLYQLWQQHNPLNAPQYLYNRYNKHGFLYSQLEFAQPQKRYPHEALSGIYQIYAETAKRQNKAKLARQLQYSAQQKLAREQKQYYGSALYLLAQVRP